MNETARRLVAGLVAPLLLCIPACAQPDAAPATPAPAFRTADDLLLALEEADRDLAALEADLRYVREFAVAGDTQTRLGTIYFRAAPAGESDKRDRRFAIDFHRLIVGRRDEDILERYVFDGQWLLEMDRKTRHFTLRQVVPPGEDFDPLRIGEGPFPIPIGQRRDEILRRFDAELVAPTDGVYEDEGDLTRFVADMHQVRLEPKPVWEDQTEFREIRLWYRRNENGRLLPRMARTRNHAGDQATVILTGIKVNDEADVPESRLDTTPPEEGWDGQVIEWRGE